MKSGKQRGKEIRFARAERKSKETKQLDGVRMVEEAPCNPNNLAPYNSYGEPEFVARGFYIDTLFQCIDCGTKEIWRATQQKWWYENAKGNVESKAVRCRPCRIKERKRKEESRKVHLEGIGKKQKERT